MGFLDDLQDALNEGKAVATDISNIANTGTQFLSAVGVGPGSQPSGSGGFSVPVSASISQETWKMIWLLFAAIIVAILLFAFVL